MHRWWLHCVPWKKQASNSIKTLLKMFWKNAFNLFIILPRRIFLLSSRGYLDPTSAIHLYSVHYVYLPRVNNSLEQFQGGWNHHGIRTADYKSPYQIFTDGALKLQQSGLHGLDFFLNVNENYGVEELGLPPEEAGNQVLSISDLQFHLMEDNLQQLQELVNLITMALICIL